MALRKKWIQKIIVLIISSSFKNYCNKTFFWVFGHSEYYNKFHQNDEARPIFLNFLC